MRRTLKAATLLLLATMIPTGAGARTDLTETGNQVKQMILETFQDQPELAKKMLVIANCESTGWLHRLPNGELRPNNQGSGAYGVFQLLINTHTKEVNRLGFNLDLSTNEGYFAYIRHLVLTQGFRPWAESKSCWGRKIG